MFLTRDDLKLSYGVDLDIAQVFVDRKVPEENLYWKDRKIYVPGSPGYLFMPIYFDILLRCGVKKDFLLSNDFLKFSESILHSAACLEHQQLDWRGHVDEVISIMLPNVQNKALYQDLKEYLLLVPSNAKTNSIFGTPFPSLNRADSYLMLLSGIAFEDFDLTKAIRGWYALMTYFLILDDLADIKEDLKNGEENVFIESGLNDNGLKIISELIDHSYLEMEKINPVMANRIDHKRAVMDLRDLLRSIITS